ncbi:glycosyltransferase [Collinsella stercoris]|uniref:Glycosyltransferase n=1 Tax=Slackia piriformis TaxID=626934 RepID=A0A943Z8I4_9ACTN|nr:glycosyltransferase [Slackia piriformis]
MNAPLAALAIPYDAIEAIVVDDGSTDGTAGILEAFTAGNHRVRILRQEDQDRSRRKEQGLSHPPGRRGLCS